MGKLADERLHRFFDGELASDDAAAVAAAMTDDDRLKLAALAEIRGLTAAALDAEAADIDLWPALRMKLATTPSRSRWSRLARRVSYAGAGLAAGAALLLMLKPATAVSNDCDVEILEADGATATVLKMPDSTHPQSPSTTLIWTEED